MIKRLYKVLVVSLALVAALQSSPVFALTESGFNGLVNDRAFYDDSQNLCASTTANDAEGIPDGSPGERLKAFVDRYGELAYENSITSGVPYDFTLAQAIIEGGYDSTLATKYNNLFGIKADSSWTGERVSLPTREVIDGQNRTVMAEWRVYASPKDSFADHDKFLRENPRYANAFNYSSDSIQFLTEVKAAGYATDPNYVSVVGGVINSIRAYVEETGAFPPVTEVEYNISEPVIDGNGGITSTGASCTGQTGSIAGLECPNTELNTVQVGSTTYYQLPEALGDEYTIYSIEKRRYGHKELVCAIYTVAKAYKAKYDGRSKVSVGDLNAAGHKSHKWGVAVDIDAPGNLYAADHTKGNYSKEATIDFGKLWVDTGILKNIWWCPPAGDDSIEQIRSYAQAAGKPLNSIKCISGHANHFHVDINTERGDAHTP